jgi:hypothetical protein
MEFIHHSPHRGLFHNRRQLLAKAPAFSRVAALAVRGRTILVMAKRQRPHPGRSYGCCVGFEDAADNRAILEHVVIVVIPFPGAGEADARAFSGLHRCGVS